MRFMVIVKASRESEAGVMPGTELLTAMGKFNAEMVQAGVMQAGEGLHPSMKGARVKYSGGDATVSRGPFSLTGDLVSGFWLIQTKSLDEGDRLDEARAIRWRRRDRNPSGFFTGRFWRGADAGAARAGGALARPGGEPVTAKDPQSCDS